MASNLGACIQTIPFPEHKVSHSHGDAFQRLFVMVENVLGQNPAVTSFQ